MFDYQAGEKYKLTLIMVGLVGMLGGVFFTVLLMPTPTDSGPRRRPPPKWASNPDATGGVAGGQPPARYGQESAMAGQTPPSPQGAQPMAADPFQAQQLLESKFLPLAWDLSAFSARASQNKAIAYMTDECKRAYMTNIWTTEVAQQIEQSGVQSQFKPRKIVPGPLRADGSVEVTVEGEQTLSVPNKGSKTREVKVVYLVKQYPDGLKIAGISEAGQTQ